MSENRKWLGWLALAAGLPAAVAMGADDAREAFLGSARAVCLHGAGPGREISRGSLVLGPGRAIGYGNFLQANGDILRVYEPNPRSGERLYEFYQKTPRGVRAAVSAKLDGACAPVEGREIEYDAAERAAAILWLGRGLERSGIREELNPPVPPASNHVGVRVALVDSGVNYLVPAVSQALARDAQGRGLGYDFREMDDRPFDVDPLKRGPFVPVRHGTSVASVLLADGKGSVSLIPYSFPGSDPRRFRLLVEDMRRKGVRIANLSMGSADPRAEPAWQEIAAAMRAAPEILFVVAAGNEGRDIDQQPSYPAAFRLANVLMVGSVDTAGSVSPLSNYGMSVDVAAVSDPVLGRDFEWREKPLQGTSFAAPRIAALAANLLKADPGLGTLALKGKICAMAKPVLGPRRIACGYFD